MSALFGNLLAFIAVLDEGLSLELLHLPGGEEESVTLVQALTREELLEDQTSPCALAY